MSTPSNFVSESFESPRTQPSVALVSQPFYWSVRRELWENRSIYVAPLAVAAVTLLGFLIASMGYALSTTDMAVRRAALQQPSSFAMGVIMVTAFIVGIFYSLDALHGERRDRSILFWKSLPVSDVTTVLSKASIPIVVLPLLTFVIVLATQWIMLLLSTLVLMASGLSTATLWTPSSFLQMPLMLLYHLVTVHVLWHAPLYGWMILVSAWAKRATFLWAILPVAVIGILEKIVFNTTHFIAMLGYRLSGPGEFDFAQSGHALHSTANAALGTFISSPGLWLGLAAAVAFLAAAVRLRRSQGPI